MRVCRLHARWTESAQLAASPAGEAGVSMAPTVSDTMTPAATADPRKPGMAADSMTRWMTKPGLPDAARTPARTGDATKPWRSGASRQTGSAFRLPTHWMMPSRADDVWTETATVSRTTCGSRSWRSRAATQSGTTCDVTKPASTDDAITPALF